MKRLLAPVLFLLMSFPLMGSDMTHSPCFQSGGYVKCYPATGIKVDNGKLIGFYELTSNGTNHIDVKAPSSLGADFVMTLPAATDTFVGKATSDVFTNKSIDGGTNTLTNISLSASVTSVLPIANGGTSAATKAAAFDALQPMTAAGDIIYGGTSGAGTRLAKGTSLTVLHSGTTPTFSAVNIASGGDVTGALPIANGGTGQTTQTAGFDALSPMTAAGDIIYGGTSGSGTKLAKGTSLQVLHSGTTPTFSAVNLASGGDVTGVLPVANGGTGVSTNFNALGATATPYSSSTLFVRSGTFTPVLANIANVASSTITANSMLWTQVGQVVACSGGFTMQCSVGAPTSTEFSLTLPITPTSNFASAFEGGGTMTMLDSGTIGEYDAGNVQVVSGAKLADLFFKCDTTSAARILTYTFQYLAN